MRSFCSFLRRLLRLGTDGDRIELVELFLGSPPARSSGELLISGECSSIGSRFAVEGERSILGGNGEVDIGLVRASEVASGRGYDELSVLMKRSCHGVRL